jgi:SAM-dependent methyltransferase
MITATPAFPAVSVLSPEGALSSSLRSVIQSPAADDILNAAADMFRVSHSGAIHRSHLLPATQLRLDTLEKLELVTRDGNAVRLTLTGRHVGNFGKEIGNWNSIGGVKNFLPPGVIVEGKRFLDCGCGSGRYMIAAAQAGASFVAGVDPQALYLDLLQAYWNRRHSANMRLVRAGSEKTPFLDKSFDLVWSRIALMYCNVRKTFAEWQRITAPGGLIVLRYETLGSSFRMFLKDRSPKRLFGLFNTGVLQVLHAQISLPGTGMESRHRTVYPTLAWTCRQLSAHGFRIEFITEDGTIVARKS